MKKFNFIYITTNLINQKQYVGSHYGTENDGYLGSGRPIFKNAIKKYGKENFKRKILEECDRSVNLILESKYIKQYNTLSPNGYNISDTGGLGLQHALLNEEIRKKISLSCKGRKSWNKGLKCGPSWNKGLKCENLSEDTKQKISKTLKEKYKNKENHPCYGKKLTNEHKQKIGKGLSGNVRKITPDILNEILKMIDDGISISKIYRNEKFKVCYQTVYRIKCKYRPDKIKYHK